MQCILAWSSEPPLSESSFIRIQKACKFHEFHYNLQDGGHIVM